MQEYTSSARSLGLNLKRNGSLRQRLLDEELDAHSLVRMNWQELSTDERRKQDSKVQVRRWGDRWTYGVNGSRVGCMSERRFFAILALKPDPWPTLDPETLPQEKLLRLATLYDANSVGGLNCEDHSCPECKSTACQVLSGGR